MYVHCVLFKRAMVLEIQALHLICISITVKMFWGLRLYPVVKKTEIPKGAITEGNCVAKLPRAEIH